MPKRRRKRPSRQLSQLTVAQILDWADEYYERRGGWPNVDSRAYCLPAGETWKKLNANLCQGNRGLPPGVSLANLLARERGLRNSRNLPPLTIPLILKWADAHNAHTGTWPRQNSGRIAQSPVSGDTWAHINSALRAGRRGLSGSTTLAQLLLERRQAASKYFAPRLTEAQILAWADAFFQRNGHWPATVSEGEALPDGETWCNIDHHLRQSGRGLPGGSSLRKLLAEHRGARDDRAPPRITIAKILRWADAHQRRAGIWPRKGSGPVLDCPIPGETWWQIDDALRKGTRGLPGGQSLPRLLADRRGVRTNHTTPPLTVEQILKWADEYYAQHSSWPTRHSGVVNGYSREQWMAIDGALRAQHRGLPKSSLISLLAKHRGVRNYKRLAKLREADICRWCKEYFDRAGQWPSRKCGLVVGAPSPGDTWQHIDRALIRGSRGLRGGSSLARLVGKLRRRANRRGTAK